MIEDTLVAIATPPGRGGIGIVRLSGPKAYIIALTLTHKNVLTPRTALYCGFYDEQEALVDEGILLYFKAPHSFTGEDVIELQVHGAPIVLDKLLRVSVNLGARLARPGEFSERAFLNGKIDLTQAEAIADLIHASSETAARMAQRSLQGDFSQKINTLNEKIIQLRMYVEAAIDFSEEEIDFLSDGRVQAMLVDIQQTLAGIRANACQGVIMREGLSIVIAGLPNAGKSTLINALVGKEVAIVSTVAGTTRDVMREHILLDDIPLHLIDTAGLRESEDIVEQEGVRRAWQEVARADCLLVMIDASAPDVHQTLLSERLQQTLPKHVPIIEVFNKIDTSYHLAHETAECVWLSAKTGEGLDLLKSKIKKMVGYQPLEGEFLARRRHIQALDAAKNFLDNGFQQLICHKAGELLAEDLRLAHQSLCEITGEFTSDDLLGHIFSSFCIGK